MDIGSFVLKWTAITLEVLGCIVQILEIGKPRNPRTANDAAVNVALTIIILLLIMIYWK